MREKGPWSIKIQIALKTCRNKFKSLSRAKEPDANQQLSVEIPKESIFSVSFSTGCKHTVIEAMFG